MERRLRQNELVPETINTKKLRIYAGSNMNNEKKTYPIKYIVHWYYGNYCTRKCFDKEERLKMHYDKLEEFADRNPCLKITHREFLMLFNDTMLICTLQDSFKRKAIGWILFDILMRTPNYDSNKIIVENRILRKRNGPLEKPRPRCRICAALGVPI